MKKIIFLFLLIPTGLLLWLIAFLGTSYFYGYVDTKGRFVIPPRFETATDFKGGKAIVTVSRYGSEWLFSCEGYWNFTIDQKGKTIGYPRFVPDDCGKEPDDTYTENSKPAEESELYPFPEFEATPLKNGDYRQGYKNSIGTWVIPPQFLRESKFYKGVAWVMPFNSEGNSWGLINQKGEYVLSPKCRVFGNFHDGLARCRVKTLFALFY